MLSSLLVKNNKNYLLAFVEYGWYPFLLFLSTRYFVEYLGGQKYGFWMFLTAIVASTSILTIGISGAVIKVVSTELGRGASAKVIEGVANTALGIALTAGALTSLIMMILGLVGWQRFSMDYDHLYVTAVAVTVLVFLEFIDNAFSSVLKGGEHFRETARIEVIFKTAQILVALAVVVFWANISALYSALVIVTLARVFAKMTRMKRVCGISHVRPAFDCFSKLIVLAKWGWLQGIGGFMFAIFDRLFVGYILGVEALAYYSLILMIPQQIHSLVGSTLSVTFPRISSLLSTNQIGAIKVLKSKISNLIVFAAAIPLLFLVIFSDVIFRLWLGRDLPPNAMAALLPLALAFFLLSLTVLPYYMLLGLGQVRYVAVVHLIAGISSMITLALWLDDGGVYIAAISKLVYGAILSVQFYRLKYIMTQLIKEKNS
jgi:O-antigen/teichoic acid export membrane protein